MLLFIFKLFLLSMYVGGVKIANVVRDIKLQSLRDLHCRYKVCALSWVVISQQTPNPVNQNKILTERG